MSHKQFTDLPPPARHLVDMNSYKYFIEGEPALSLIAQLGCPFHCTFCSGRNSPFLRKIRLRDIDAVVDEVEKLLNQAEEIASKQPGALKKKFEEKVAALLDNKQGIDRERLAQEIVLLATKADTKEETDRLRAHIASARVMLDASGPVGRKMDFLTQEFNREANTLCSKSSDIALTNVGLSLKTAIDQIREQVQNVE